MGDVVDMPKPSELRRRKERRSTHRVRKILGLKRVDRRMRLAADGLPLPIEQCGCDGERFSEGWRSAGCKVHGLELPRYDRPNARYFA